VVDGCRIPFMPSGGAYNDYLGQQLLLFAMKGLLTRTGMDLNLPDYVIGGTVIQEGEKKGACAVKEICDHCNAAITRFLRTEHCI